MPDIIRHDPEPSLVELGRADAVSAIHDDNGAAYIQCPCGFRVSGHDESENRRAYEGHDCERITTPLRTMATTPGRGTSRWRGC